MSKQYKRFNKAYHLAEERQLAIKAKDFKESDRLREEINALGYVITDTKDSFHLSWLRSSSETT